MAWTAPRTWVAGETVTAAILNTHLRDNLLMLSDAWASYTVTWTAATTNPTLGNGTLTGAHLTVGKWERYRIFLDYGSTTSAGTGSWFFTNPTAVISGTALAPRGVATCYDGSVIYPRNVIGINTTTVALADHASTRVGPTTPFSWNSSSELHIIGQYEAA